MALRLKVFADENIGHDGLIYKAGLQSEAAGIDNLGIGYDDAEWIAKQAGTNLEEVHGGLKVEAAQETSSSFYINLNIATEKKVKLASRGSFQIDYYLTDLTSKTAVNQWLMQSGKAGTFALGIVDKFNYISGLSGYNAVTKDYNDAEALVNAVSLTTTSDQYDTTKHPNTVTVLHDGLETVGGFITYAKSWNSNWVDTFINGVLVSRIYRKDGAVDATVEIELFKFQLNVAVTMRNLLVYDRPFESMKGDLRILEIGHSYVERESLPIQDSIGTPSPSSGFTGLEKIGAQLHKNIARDIDFRALGKSGDTMSLIYDRINDASLSYAIGTGTYISQASRFRPHFAIVCGHSNGKGTFGTIAEGVDAIADLLISRGVIPVFCNEQQRTRAPADISAGNAEYIAAITSYQLTKDIGKIDIWDATGGDVVDDTLIESGDSSNHHPNMKAFAIYGSYIAEEINRLLVNPPSYSNLAKGK